MGNESSAIDTGPGGNPFEVTDGSVGNPFEYNPNENGKVVKFLTNENKANLNTEKIEEIQKQQESHYKVDDNTTTDQFYNFRNESTPDETIKLLDDLGTCLNGIDTKVAKKYCTHGINDKILFIVCNTYTKPQYKLGVGPINDALTVAIHHKKMGYNIVYLHNSTVVQFKKWLKFILMNTSSDLTIFYTGHGSQKRDTSGDEADGYDEVMVFDEGFVVDDELANYLVKYAHGQRIVLLTDCCHSGSIWDIQSILSRKENVSPNIISISASADNETSKQTKFGTKDQGIFTYYFWQVFEQNNAITTTQMKAKIDPMIRRFGQKLEYASTSDGIVNDPIFPHSK
ncbi:hypothetical protein M9Y10_002077 [Tritrichomonas musculus]|uniref:Peptidase C14 caspase domain-containing protein n=1 Tax=Tritrichomonas musculus TaxID=1915356 RepID=A0ABR2L8S0_9EUKA